MRENVRESSIPVRVGVCCVVCVKGKCMYVYLCVCVYI